MQVNVVIVTGPAGVLADQPGFIGLVYGDLEVNSLVVELTANINIGGRGAHGEAGDKTTLHQFMRIVAQNVAVLAGAGFGFVGIDHQVGRAAIRLLWHE